MGKSNDTTSSSRGEKSPIKGKKSTEAKAKTNSPKTKKTTTNASGNGGGGSAEDKIMKAMANFYVRGNITPERKKIESITGIAPKTLANAITKFKKNGLLELPDGKTMKLTDKGIEQCVDETVMGTTNEQVHERIINEDLKSKNRHVELFRLLQDGEIHSKDVVARKMNFEKGKSTKGFQNICGEMKSKYGLVEYPTRDTIQLVHDVCFPFGK